MFLEIHLNDFEDGTKYAILTSYNVGIYTTATFVRCQWDRQTFENPKEHSGNTYNILESIKMKIELFMINHKMFVRVDVDKLVLDTKYKIEAGDRIWVGYYKGTGDSIEFVYRGTIYAILPHRYFYQFVTDNPRWNMERRTVNMIVRQLIGDECFEW